MIQYSNSVTNNISVAVEGASVTVMDQNGNKATIYSDGSGTVTPNPLTTDANGLFTFWAYAGTYDIEIQKSGLSGRTLDNIVLTDPLADFVSFSNTTDVTKGDALVSGKRTDTGAVAFTLHEYNENRIANVMTDFDATGDGTTDDKAAIQAAADANLNLWFPYGTYSIGSALSIRSGAKWFFENGSTIKLAAAFSTSTAAISNATIPVGLDNRSDSDIVIDGATFDGSSIANRTNSFISLVKCIRPVVKNCVFKNHTHMGIADGGCLNGKYTYNTFIDCGRTDAPTPAIWAQSYSVDLTDTVDVTVANNTIKNNRRSGIHMHANGGLVEGNVFDGCGESSIFLSGGGLGTSLGRDIRIIGNVIRNTTIDNVTANGIEMGVCQNITVVGNTFDSCAVDAISIMNGRHIVISGNTIRNSGQESNSAGISVVTSASESLTCDDILISNNVFVENQGTPTQLYCLKLSQSGAGPSNITGLKFVDNHIEGGYDVTNGEPVFFSSASVKLADDAVFQDFGNGQRNLLINGKFDLFSRGASFTSVTTPANNDDTYLADNWLLLSDGNDIVDVSQNTAWSSVPTGSRYSIKLLVATANTKFGILQILPASEVFKLRSRYVSLSFKALMSGTTTTLIRASVLEWIGTQDGPTSDVVSSWNASGTNPTLAANWSYLKTPITLWALVGTNQTYRITGFPVSSSANNLAVFIWSEDTSNTAGDYIQIADVRMTASHLPINPIIDVSTFEEKQRASFFFERISADGVGDPFANGAAHGTADFKAVLEHQPKRITPAYSFSGSTAFDATVAGAAVAGGTITAAAIGGPPYSKALLNINKNASFTAGQGGYVSSSGASDYIDVSAEL